MGRVDFEDSDSSIIAGCSNYIEGTQTARGPGDFIDQCGVGMHIVHLVELVVSPLGRLDSTIYFYTVHGGYSKGESCRINSRKQGIGTWTFGLLD